MSFLGYFFRTFPSELARQARRAEPAGRADVESPDRRPGGNGEAPEQEGPEVPFWAGDLTSLPELDRQVVLLRALEGQPMKWVARQVGVPVETAFRLYEQARWRLAPRSQWSEGRGSIAMRRLVRALHLAALPDRRLPSRDWAMSAAGLKRGEYDQLMRRLEWAGAIYGRQQRVPGRLVERDAAATLARVGVRSDAGAGGPEEQDGGFGKA